MKHYCIKQHDVTDCGAACLATVNEPKSPADIDNMVVDMYIGVTDNIL